MQIVYKPCPVCKGEIKPLVPQPESKDVFYCNDCDVEFIASKSAGHYFYVLKTPEEIKAENKGD